MKSRVWFNNATAHFTLGDMFLWFFLYTVVGAGYFYLISRNVAVAIFVGLVFALPFFYSINVSNKVIAYKEREANALSKYVQLLVFQMKTGKNILDSLRETKPLVDPLLHTDIERTIEILETNGVLDVRHFQRYKAHTVNLFHNVLRIKATKGGKSETLFKNTTKDISKELEKRDELSRRKSYILMEVYMMLGISAAMPALLSYTAETVYLPFVQTVLGTQFLMVYFFLIYLTIHFMNRKRQDISVTV